jgi:regulatory protein PHO2
MEVPFDSITNTDFDDTPIHGPQHALVKFWLSRPPTFYLETTGAGQSMGNQGRISLGGFGGRGGPPAWKRCADWTEGTQATSVLRHDFLGSTNHITQLLRLLRSTGHGFQIAPLNLINPSYMASYETNLARGASINPPSSAGLAPSPSSGYGYENPPLHRARSFTGPSSFNIPFSPPPHQDRQTQSYSPLNSYVSSQHVPSPRNRSSLPNLDSSFSQGMPPLSYASSDHGQSGDYSSGLLHPRPSISHTPPSVTPPIRASYLAISMR